MQIGIQHEDLETEVEISAKKDTSEEEKVLSSKEAKTVKTLGQKLRSLIWDVFLLVCVFIAVMYFIPTYVVERTVVDGHSMENNFHDKDNVLVNKLSYRWKKPERFDVITFYPYGREENDSFGTFVLDRLRHREKVEDEYYIKRVIGLPGETVQIRESDIYINGEKLQENYGNSSIENAGMATDPITLEKDEYFVLGDNRGNSTDSRMIGPVKFENISGKVIFH